MRLTSVVLLTCVLAAPRPARAEERPPIIAVFDIDNKTAEVKKALAQSLTDQLRVRLAATKRVVVIDKTEQEAALKRLVAEQQKASYAACVDDACQIPLGKELAANRILRTRINRFGKTFVLSGELVDLTTGGSAGAASVECDGTEDALLAAVGELATQIAGGGGGAGASANTAGPAALGALPALSGKLAPGGVVNLDVEADLLVAYDAAIKADAAGAADPAAAVTAWEAVAAQKGKNPFKADAAKRAKEWKALAEKKKELEAQRGKDLENLKKVLPLESLPAETKVDLIRRYLGAYGQAGLSAVLTDALQGKPRELICEALIDAEEYPKTDIETYLAWSFDGSSKVKKPKLDLRLGGRSVSANSVRLPPCTFQAEVKSELGHSTQFTLGPLAAGERLKIMYSRFISVDGGKSCGAKSAGCRDLESGLTIKHLGRTQFQEAPAKCAALEPRGAWRMPKFSEVQSIVGIGWGWANAREDGYAPSAASTGTRHKNLYFVFAGDEWTLLYLHRLFTPDTCTYDTRHSSGDITSVPGLRTVAMRSDRNGRECLTSAELICVRN